MACMQCFAGLVKIPLTRLEFVKDPEQAKLDAAAKLKANMARVVQDITNPGPKNIDGKALTQTGLKRVDPKYNATVQDMVGAVHVRLTGGVPTTRPASPAHAKVWAHAAYFLGMRLQGAPSEMPGREPDMDAAAAAEMRGVLAQVEAAARLMYNREYVVLDITNPGPGGVGGGPPSQVGLQRLNRKHKAMVEQMVDEVSGRLLGKYTRLCTVAELGDRQNREVMDVWAKAASFLGQRVQDPYAVPCPGREPDMSTLAAGKLRSMLAKMEAAHMLMSNRERVVKDITNPGPANIDGKTLTQPGLKRVDPKYKDTANAMIELLVNLLLDQKVSLPSSPLEVWNEAAVFLAGRVQGGAAEMPGREPDMSANAATVMRRALGQIEAYSKLMSNCERVVKDITNPGPANIEGKTLTQPELARVEQFPACKEMIGEVCGRLLGLKKSKEPQGAQEEAKWAAAAEYLSGRIQASAYECPGRKPDMGPEAAAALRKVLASISKKT